jgi:hypothetical protein
VPFPWTLLCKSVLQPPDGTTAPEKRRSQQN